MTDTTTHQAADVTSARTHATDSWNLFTLQKGYKATVPDWQTRACPDGSVLLSGQVVGNGAEYALARFARDHYLVLGQYGDQRPQFDITQPGRTVLVWLYGGVWVELWHPETAVDTPKAAEPVHDAPAPPVAVPAAPEPKPKPAAPVCSPVRSLISRASGRLPYTRNRRKETPAA